MNSSNAGASYRRSVERVTAALLKVDVSMLARAAGCDIRSALRLVDRFQRVRLCASVVELFTPAASTGHGGWSTELKPAAPIELLAHGRYATSRL